MPKFASGVVKFQNEIFPLKKDLFERLSEGQSPEALFIACSDARVETAMITQTDPGELFIVRNAGNIVPPHSAHTGGVTASIEFAVAALKVPHVVVCGHTECGAMKGAMGEASLDGLPHIREWLGYSRAAVEVTNVIGADGDDEQRMKVLLQQNVILQLRHLKTHPAVAARLARKELCLHGWVYDIKTGAVDAYDEAKGAFVPVAERYAAEVARQAGAVHRH